MTISPLKELLAAARARKRLLASLSADPRPRVFSAPWGVAVVHLDTCRPGPDGRPHRWRATYLDEHREPVGHGSVESYSEALEKARDWGARLDRELPGPF